MIVAKPVKDQLSLKRDRDELARQRDRAAIALMDRDGLDFCAAYLRVLNERTIGS